MNYLFKTTHGEYEITAEERQAIFELFVKYGNRCWVELPNDVAVHNSNWDIVPIKESGALDAKPRGKAEEKKCCESPAIQIRYRQDKHGNKRYVPQCVSCLHVGVQMKTHEVAEKGYDLDTVEPVIEKP